MHSTTLNQDYQKQQSKAKKPLVLIVDNDHDNLLLASCVIQSLGIDFLVTENSEECLDLVLKLLPDIILLDIVMPKINGLEITRIIKQNHHISHIQIIAITGLTRAEDKSKIIAAGCDDYLCKPYLIEELETKILNFLKHRSV